MHQCFRQRHKVFRYRTGGRLVLADQFATAADPSADFFPSGSPDGVFNFFDVAEFISLYNDGCP